MRLWVVVSATMLLSAIGLAWFGLRPSITQVAESEFALGVAEVEVRLQQIFSPAERILRISRDWIGTRAPALDSPDQFNHIFQPSLKVLPQFTSVVAGTSTGEAWLLLQQTDGGWLNRLTDPQHWKSQHLIVVDDPHDGRHQHFDSLHYDARQRPWFDDTEADNPTPAVKWTAPYRFFTTGDPGVTASLAWRLMDGRSFVLGFDLMLRDLSRATMQAKVGKTGLALVVTDDWRVLALPAAPGIASEEAWLKRTLAPVSDLDLPTVTDALGAWKRAGQPTDKVSYYRSGARDWLVSARPYQLGTQTLWVLVLAPENDFHPSWIPLLGVLGGVLILVWLAAMLIGLSQVRRFTRPLEALAKSSERIGQLDFAGDGAVRSPIIEIQQLASAQDEMRTTLQRYHETVDMQAAGMHEQIEALRAAEARLRESEAYNKILFHGSRIPLLVLEPETGVFIDCNPAAVAIFGMRERSELVGLSLNDVSAPNQYDDREVAQLIAGHIAAAMQQGSHIFALRHCHADSTPWDAEVHLMGFQHGESALLQMSVQDVTERRRVAERLEQLAFFDPLTGLTNRSRFLEQLLQAIESAQHDRCNLAVLFLDLDHFKEINDTQGHAVGDQVLVAVGQRFAAVLSENEMLARMGGDEFVVVAAAAEQSAALQVAQRLQQALASPLEVNDQYYSLRVSIGIALFPDDGQTPDELLKHADIAMYKAKAYGSSYRSYRPEMSVGMAERMALARDLLHALHGRGDELQLHYQPQVDLQSRQLVGAEALLRWRHPSRGMIMPTTFIPLAEERGMMAEVGEWVLRAACADLARWSAQGMHLEGRLAINIAAQQIDDLDFAVRTEDVVRESGISTAMLELELTETGLMRNVTQALGSLTRLKVAGFGLAIDDFGTGYSSMAYLKMLPADKIKIDKSFVRDMLDDRNDHAIVATIIGMGRNLHLRTIAEGVETERQAAALAALGCEHGQGYLFGMPVPPDEFARQWLKPQAED